MMWLCQLLHIAAFTDRWHPSDRFNLRGVGTTGLKLETFIEGAAGIGVDENTRSAYQFISQSYMPEDESYLFFNGTWRV